MKQENCYFLTAKEFFPFLCEKYLKDRNASGVKKGLEMLIDFVEKEKGRVKVLACHSSGADFCTMIKNSKKYNINFNFFTG